MSAVELISKLTNVGISLKVDGDDLQVQYKEPLTDEQIDYLKDHKPELLKYLQNAPVLGVEIQMGEDVDIYGRKQCWSCGDWQGQRCNHAKHTNRDAYGNKMYLRPDPDRWWRCENYL